MTSLILKVCKTTVSFLNLETNPFFFDNFLYKFLFHIDMKTFKDLSAKYYQNDEKRLKKDTN